MLAIVGAGVVGFLDDWIKVRNERNLGLNKRDEDARPARRVDRLRRRCYLVFTSGRTTTLVVHPLRSARHRARERRLGRSSRCFLILGHDERGEPHRRARRPRRGSAIFVVRRRSSSSGSGRSATRTSTSSPHALDLAVVRRGDARRVRRVPLVERRAGPDLHGRHRLARHRCRPRVPGAHDEHRAAAADRRRAVRDRDAVGDPPGGQLPAVPPARLPHGADPPPLRARRLARDDGRSSASGSSPASCTALAPRPLLRRLHPHRGRPTDAGALVYGLGVTGEAVAGALRGTRHRAVDGAPTTNVRAGRRAPASTRDGAGARLARSTSTCSCRAPGVPEHHPVFVAATEARGARRQRVRPRGRVGRRAPAVVAITGTDGKTTVTTLVTAMLDASGRKALAVGNTDVPLVAAIDDPTSTCSWSRRRRSGCVRSERFAPDGGDVAEPRARPPRLARIVERVRGSQGPHLASTSRPATSRSATPTTRSCMARAVDARARGTSRSARPMATTASRDGSS